MLRAPASLLLKTMALKTSWSLRRQYRGWTLAQGWRVQVLSSYWSSRSQFSPWKILMFNSLHVYSPRSVSVLRLRCQCKCNSSSPDVLHWRSCHFLLRGKHTQLEVWIFFVRWHFLAKTQIEYTQKHAHLWTGNSKIYNGKLQECATPS